MSQTIALGVKTPTISLADIERAAQQRQMDDYRIRDMQRKDVLGQIGTQQQLDEARALDDYRMRADDKDPEAIEALNAYPEQQKKLWDAFDGMSPEQYKESAKMAKAFGAAAKRVSSFAEGSPEQAEAWASEITKLHDDGFIDENTRDLYLKQGPDMNIVNEALDIGKWAESYTGKNAVNRARAENYEGKTENEAALTQARVGTEKSKAELNTVRGKVAQENVNSLDKYRTGSIEQKAEAAAAETERKTAKDAMPPKPRATAPQDPNKAKNTALTVEQKIENLLRNKRKALAITESDISTAESGRTDNMADVEALTNFNDTKRRVEEYRAYEANLRKQGGPTQAADGKKPLGASGDQDGSRAKPYTPKSRDEAQKLPAGAWFMDPKGNLIQKQ